MLADDKAQPVLLASFDPTHSRLTLRPVKLPAIAADKSLELWLLPPAGAAPRPLGLLTPAGLSVVLEGQDARDIAAAALAVSLEPQGGSPTGLPTGPVLYSGAVLSAS